MDKLCLEAFMRIHEIIDNYDDYIDKDKMSPELYDEITRTLDRQDGGTMTPEIMQIMYGHDVEFEDLVKDKLRAEIRRANAAADQDDADASSS